jgi:hypothetical protein
VPRPYSSEPSEKPTRAVRKATLGAPAEPGRRSIAVVKDFPVRREAPPPTLAVQIARASAPNFTEPATPDIHVSIGRVEIRAIQGASKPARKTGPTGPKLTLDDYLSSRQAGGR